MTIPSDEFLQRLHKLVSTHRVLSDDEFLFEVEVIFARGHDDSDELRLSEYLRTESSIGKIEGWSAARASILESLEGFSDPQTAQWIAENSRSDRDRESVAFIFDDLYTRNFLRKTENIVDRTMKLSAIAPKAIPDRGVELYLREASRCLIHGFWNSSVALSRAALELGLKHRLKGMLGGFIPSEDDLKLLLEFAQQYRVIDGAEFEMGDQVRRAGNKVLHGSQADEPLAWETLSAVRGALRGIYGSK
jgi:hypothetical protein